MIPSTNTQLLVAEDWKKVYQSFRNADFKSYDFETLRRTMISYLQENYPEDFNDYIDSSEYIALIDVIAYLGQNLSFRIDLNARENFLETAQRRDSILRLAQLVSYNPTRNIPANGFLKVTAVSTSDNVFDSNGVNLSDTTIGWNDSTNPDWYQQFVNIMNSAMSSNFGTPAAKKTISGMDTEQYRISSINTDTPIFGFSKNINGTNMNFEIVPSTFDESKDYIYEEAPAPGNSFSLIYKDDNQGSASINTGFFTHFRQGTLSMARFSVDNPVPNEIVGVNTPDINDTDVWVWQLDKTGNFNTLWSQVPNLVGNNVIYNSLSKNLRTIYAVSSRDEDQIDLNFADGVFGDLPTGEFRLFYRQSNGLSYVIKPEQMSGVLISVPYQNKLGQNHILQLTLSLQYTVTNSAGPESNASIQSKAPQVYYTQNRMITAEDYNIAPLRAGSDILKVKSVNRVSSGLSKYFELSDVSGQYSKTNIFADDGILYKDPSVNKISFGFTGRNQVLSFVKNTLAPIIASPATRSIYFEQYPRDDLTTANIVWKEVNKLSSESRGYFYNSAGSVPLGIYSANMLDNLTVGANVKFNAPAGKYFDQKNNLKVGTAPAGARSYIWATVKQIVGDGNNGGLGTLSDGTGPVIFNARVPDGAIPSSCIPGYTGILDYSVEIEITNLCMLKKNFGLTINVESRQWDIILNSNLNLLNPFDLTAQGSVEDTSADSSWIIAFVWTGSNYEVRYRSLGYIFESRNETAFFVDNTTVNYDYTSNTTIKDKIDVLSVNTIANTNNALGVNYTWQIDSSIVEQDGYVDPKKVKVSFYDYNDTGQITDPDSFDLIVGNEFVYFEKNSDGLRYQLVDDIVIIPFLDRTEFNRAVVTEVITLADGDLFYFYSPAVNAVLYWSAENGDLIYTDQYFGRQGRSDIKFQYQHNSGRERRIDPSKTNIIDVYTLTSSYDNEVRSWLLGNTDTQPLPPTSQSLEQNYAAALSPIKSISDEIIFHPVSYKILFGERADINLRAVFKAVRNSSRPTNDNDLKTRILAAITEFFSLENWEFGQSFYFSELSTYVMNKLTPDITNFVIVPMGSSGFGSYYEITCQSNEIFISGANIMDIEIIDSITASQLKSSTIITNSGT
jgi:hypothetical protein